MEILSFLPSLVHRGFVPGVVFDINVIVNVHYKGKYKRRLEFFKRYGLTCGLKYKIHVTIVCSSGDAGCATEILKGWPTNIHVTLLEGRSSDPLPKMNGFYLWLKDSGLVARWHLKVDDDSWSDLDNIVLYADRYYGGMPIHLMTPPIHHDQHLHHVLKELDLHIAVTHEHECSLTSDAAFAAVFQEEKAMNFLSYVGERYHWPSDLCLAWAIHICGIPALECHKFTKDFHKTDTSITGGSFYHIHYVNWEDDGYVIMLDAFFTGKQEALKKDDILSAVGRPLSFGRCIGHFLNELVLEENGVISGNHDKNETFWKIVGDKLVIYSEEHVAKTIFTTRLTTGLRTWFVGSYAENTDLHFLRVE